MSHSSASAIMRTKWTARALSVGSVPGWPRQTGQVRVLGSSPKDSAQRQNIFVRVCSCTWISRPMTGSNSGKEGSCGVESDSLLERVGGVQEAVLGESRSGNLEADRQIVREPGRYRDRRDPRERHRDRTVVGQVHRERVAGALAELEGDRRRGRRDDEVAALERAAEVVGDLGADPLGA